MKCSDIQELLSAYLDGELSDKQATDVDEHLDRCSACANQLDSMKNLSAVAKTLGNPVPPGQIWRRLEQQLNEGIEQESPAPKRWAISVPQLAFAATVLIAATIAWFAFHGRFAKSDHDEFTIEFGEYLEEFSRDPETAQKRLLALYGGQEIDPQNALKSVGYRPVVAEGLPDGYVVRSSHVMVMPCCKCVQTICDRKDGSTLVIFEHDDEETDDWFGQRREKIVKCGGKRCCLVELRHQLAASWKHNQRYITLIGAHDIEEVSRLIAWMDRKPDIN